MQISLVREHTEAIRPPRALWVPFELGRPLGPPHNADFQLDVLRSLLDVARRPSGPVIVDYPHDAPVPADDDSADDTWACPVSFPEPEPASDRDALRRQIVDETRRLRPWYDEALRRNGRTRVGISGRDASAVEDMVDILVDFALTGEAQPAPGFDHPMPVLLRFAADDLRTYYYEAATAQPGRAAPTSIELGSWYHYETALGALLYQVRDRVVASDDKNINVMRTAIVPVVFRTRPAPAERTA